MLCKHNVTGSNPVVSILLYSGIVKLWVCSRLGFKKQYETFYDRFQEFNKPSFVEKSELYNLSDPTPVYNV